jgi:hypothetical protein
MMSLIWSVGFPPRRVSHGLDLVPVVLSSLRASVLLIDDALDFTVAFMVASDTLCAGSLSGPEHLALILAVHHRAQRLGHAHSVTIRRATSVALRNRRSR